MPTTDPQHTLDVAIGWAHAGDLYSDRQLIDGSAYAAELELMAGSWSVEYPCAAEAIELLDLMPRLSLAGLTDSQVRLLADPSIGSMRMRQMMAARMRRSNAAELGLPADSTAQQIEDALEAA